MPPPHPGDKVMEGLRNQVGAYDDASVVGKLGLITSGKAPWSSHRTLLERHAMGPEGRISTDAARIAEVSIKVHRLLAKRNRQTDLSQTELQSVRYAVNDEQTEEDPSFLVPIALGDDVSVAIVDSLAKRLAPERHRVKINAYRYVVDRNNRSFIVPIRKKASGDSTVYPAIPLGELSSEIARIDKERVVLSSSLYIPGFEAIVSRDLEEAFEAASSLGGRLSPARFALIRLGWIIDWKKEPAGDLPLHCQKPRELWLEQPTLLGRRGTEGLTSSHQSPPS